MLLLSLIGDEIDSKGLDQLPKRVNRSQLQTEISMSGCLLQNGGKGSAQDNIGDFLKEHDFSKAIDMIDEVCGPIIALQLRNLKVWWDRFLKDAHHKRWFKIEPIGWC